MNKANLQLFGLVLVAFFVTHYGMNGKPVLLLLALVLAVVLGLQIAKRITK